MPLKVPATIARVQTMADGSIRLIVDTQELAGGDMATLFSLNNKLGWMVFSESAIKEEDIADLPEVEPEFKGDKTPAQRLRGVMYVLWEQRGKKGDFELFYRTQYENLINKYKEKLI